MSDNIKLRDLTKLWQKQTNRGNYYIDLDSGSVRHRNPFKVTQEALGGEELELFPLEEAGASAAAGAVAETTPLIAGTAVAAPSLSTVSAITAGGVGTGIILGGVLGSQLTVPGHQYLGPGNSIDEDKAPVDKDDARAQLHDEQYNAAKSDQDILNADKEFIVDSLPDIIKGDPHAIIGGAGISAKHFVESVLGVKYSGTL